MGLTFDDRSLNGQGITRFAVINVMYHLMNWSGDGTGEMEECVVANHEVKDLLHIFLSMQRDMYLSIYLSKAISATVTTTTRVWLTMRWRRSRNDDAINSWSIVLCVVQVLNWNGNLRIHPPLPYHARNKSREKHSRMSAQRKWFPFQ